MKRLSRKTWFIILAGVAADYWSPQPQILSASLGFEGIIGLPAWMSDRARRGRRLDRGPEVQ